MMKLVKDRKSWRKNAILYVARQCRRMLHWISFDVTYKYSRPDLFADGKKYFMVCNHMSYMDLLFLGAGEPAVFVTSVEMKEAPFLGQCAEFGGSYFVERRDRNKIPQEIKDLAQIIRDDFHVFVFPEATSHHGMDILPFKRSMFTAAIEAGVEVLPICLRYEEIDGEPFSEKNNNKICWYGKMPFFPHFMNVMKLKSAKITVEYLEPISSREFADRALLAEKAYEQITRAYYANRPASFTPQKELKNAIDNKGENKI
jgi:lyso-ornithine lipid O-acyltransferase